ncbi:MAG: DNA-directed RNA polymerase subunit omega [Candidatus Omnitrophota bacterium]
MSYQPLEELLPRANFSIYRLVRLASKRALEISETGAKLVDAPSEQKITTTALEEIRQGKVVLKSVADAQAAAAKKNK